MIAAPNQPSSVNRRAWIRESAWILAWASIAGFLAWAGTLWTYDASGGVGPLALIGSWIGLRAVYLICDFFVQPIAYCVLIWRWGVRGAVLALIGVELLGPLLFNLLPASQVATTQPLGYGDETRGWIGFGLVSSGLI